MKVSLFSASVKITSSRGGPPKLKGSIVLGSSEGGAGDVGRRLLRDLTEAFLDSDERQGRAASPPALPRSKREVFEQRETCQRGMQQKLRNALALDTIEAFYNDDGDAKIRRLEGTGNPNAPPCKSCGVRPAVPMGAVDAAFARESFRRARMAAAAAYAFATTRVIQTQRNRSRLCVCDREAWDRAIAEFERVGRGVWRRFGLDP